MTDTPKRNVVLIGMPGSGKTTIGAPLAELLRMSFVDTDHEIIKATGRPLQQTINQRGNDYFRKKEEEVICRMAPVESVISTGGSVVYSSRAMARLKLFASLVVFLDVPWWVLAQRLGDLSGRGISMEPGQTIYQLYHERLPLYQKYADLTFSQCLDPIKATRLLASLITEHPGWTDLTSDQNGSLPSTIKDLPTTTLEGGV